MTRHLTLDCTAARLRAWPVGVVSCGGAGVADGGFGLVVVDAGNPPSRRHARLHRGIASATLLIAS